MKKYLMSIGLWMFLIAAVIPMRVSAQGRDSVRLDEQGNVTLVSEYAAKEGISSLSLSLSVDSVNGEKVEFLFNDSSAKVSEFRYNEEEKKLNIYMAGTEALFAENMDSLAIGRILVQDKNGSDTSASVSVVADSLQYVYGTELKTSEDPELPGVVQIGTSSLPVPTPGQEDNPGQVENPGDDNDSDAEDSGTSGNAGEAGSGTNKPGGNTAGTGSGTSKPGGNTAGTGNSTNKPGGNTVGTGNSTDKPDGSAGGSDNGSQSADGASQETLEGNQDADPVIGGNNIRQEDRTGVGGQGWIVAVVIIAVIITAAVIAMAVVALKNRPKDREN